MYVYSETGRLVDRIIYQDIADKCGKPESISEDGQNLIFRISNRTKELYLVKIHIDRLELVRKINIVQSINDYINEYRRIDPDQQKKMLNFWNKFLNSGENIKNLKLTYCLNDAADLLVRIRLTKSMLDQKMKEYKL